MKDSSIVLLFVFCLFISAVMGSIFSNFGSGLVTFIITFLIGFVGLKIINWLLDKTQK